jgi:hypothetical protein
MHRTASEARALIRILLTNKTPDVSTEHLRELIDTMLWKITEADGKYKTRYQSCAAMQGSPALRHDHVFTKRTLIDALINAEPDKVDEILTTTVGCTVTREEHERLTRYDRVCDGWERYRRAKVAVTDTQTGKLIVSV